MHVRAPAIVCATRAHAEVGVIVRLLTVDHGLIGAYVAGGRGRHLRPVVIPGNLVETELHSRAEGRMPSARLELVASRGPWLSEPLAASAIAWVTALTASTLPERHAYPALHAALEAALDAICQAPSARGWVPGLLSYEALLLRELGYGDHRGNRENAGGLASWPDLVTAFDRMGAVLTRYPLADRRGDVMASRALLRERLARI